MLGGRDAFGLLRLLLGLDRATVFLLFTLFSLLLLFFLLRLVATTSAQPDAKE